MTDIKELAKRLKENKDFADFQDHVMSMAHSLKDNDEISNFTSLSDEEAGQISKARLIAYDMVLKIFNPFVNFSEKPQYTVEDFRKAAARRGL